MSVKQSLKSTALAFDALLFLFAVVGIWRTVDRSGLPHKVILHDNQVMVAELRSTGIEGPLQTGDQIRAVAGQQIHNLYDVDFLIDHVPIGDSVSLLVERAGQELAIDVDLVRYYNNRFIITQTAVGCIYFFIGLLVLIWKSGEMMAFLFHWSAIAVALMIMTAWGSYTISPPVLAYASQLVALAANNLIPALFFHFSFLFPWRKKTRFNFLITPFYAVTIIAFILNAITFITASSHLSVELWQTFQRTYNLTWVLFSAGALLGLINIIHSYLTAASEPDRRKLRWVMMGMAVTIVGYTCLWPIPIVLIGHPLLALDYILLIDAVMPITFGISIIRYRFLNIDLIFNRSAVYTIVLGAMLLIYAIVLGILTTLDDSLAGRTSFFSTGIAAAAVAFMFEPTRRRVQQFVDRTLFRTRYNYKEAVDQLSKKISNAISQEHVGSELVNRLSKLLDVSCIGVYGRDQTGQRFTLLANVNCQGLMAEQLTQIDRQIPDLQLPLSSEGALEPGTPYETASGGLLKNLQLCLVMPIVADLSSRHGGLLLGPKRNGICFTQEDVDLLKAAALQAGSAMAKITLREKLVEEREATRRLAEMNELKSFFVSSVSHELKTPLTSIRMFAELLRDQQNLDESKKHEYLDIIEGESGRLSRLINNVLDLAKVERGVQEYNFETLDVNQTINTVLNSLGYQLKMHKFTVTRQLGDMELLIKADSDALIEILENLITNAMKYSGKSKEITISSSRRHDQVILSVQDRGLGIPEGDLQNIFDPFYRAKDKEHRSREGTGLGLALTKHILEAHQGEIEIDSTPGKGSTFTIKFPAEG